MPLVAVAPTSDSKSREKPRKSPFIIHATRGLRETREEQNFYKVTNLVVHQLQSDIVYRTLRFSASFYYLPGLKGSCSSANQSKGTCKEASNKSMWAIVSVYLA